MQITMGGMASCSQFCGYHSYFLYGSQSIKYVVIPYLDCAGCTYAGTSVADHLASPLDMRNTHHPVDDARGNAEALLAMKKDGLKIAL